jgi:Methyltransferase domain
VRLIDRFRQRGVAGTARFAARTGAVALRSPREALDHLETQLALTRSAPPPSPVATDPEWERRLHEALGASWPCEELAAFEELWTALDAELGGGADVGRGHDADPTLARAAWCAVRHLRPAHVVETGVSRGVTSRVILEALERNGDGHLWSIDLPPLEDPWRRLAGSAVTDGLQHRWTYVRGTSKRQLPRVVREVGTVDLFVHDSLHTPENLGRELRDAWPALRPGALVLLDDVEACHAFDGVLDGFANADAFAARQELGPDAIGIVVL